MTLTEFLLARIAEDGAALWCGLNPHADNRPACCDDAAECDWREKREWQAKRRIVALHCRYGEEFGSPDECVACGYDAGYGEAGNAPWPCDTVLALTAVYADHPDFRDEWRPWQREDAPTDPKVSGGASLAA